MSNGVAFVPPQITLAPTPIAAGVLGMARNTLGFPGRLCEKIHLKKTRTNKVPENSIKGSVNINKIIKNETFRKKVNFSI